MITVQLPYCLPEEALAAFAHLPGLAFLDSSSMGDPRGEVSYLALFPRATLQLEAAPNTHLRSWMSAHPPLAPPPAWPFAFAGGAIGWIGYDIARAAADVATRFAPLPGLPGGWFGLYDTLLGFHHATRQLHYLGPAQNLPEVAARLARPPATLPALPKLVWQAELDRATYIKRHERLRDYIAAGDIYQANLTLRFTAPRPPGLTLAALHTALRRLSPAPFAACLDTGTFGLACASPERFLRLSATGMVEARPIKGTAARRDDPDDDVISALDMHASPKERAENLMITDLIRNDLGQVCDIGSIRVPELYAVESYAQAHHLVSAVTGQLRSELDAFDLLAATLPGGSITGAPKRRALQIIDELEEGPRGAYCGALAWIGFDGAMDSAIIIRTLAASADTLYAQAGGGITWDSMAQAEYEEAMVKISPLLALGQ